MGEDTTDTLEYYKNYLIDGLPSTSSETIVTKISTLIRTNEKTSTMETVSDEYKNTIEINKIIKRVDSKCLIDISWYKSGNLNGLRFNWSTDGRVATQMVIESTLPTSCVFIVDSGFTIHFYDKMKEEYGDSFEIRSLAT